MSVVGSTGLKSLDQGGGLSGGQIAGVVLGVLLAMAMIAGGIYLLHSPPDPLKPYLDPTAQYTNNPGSNINSSSRDTRGPQDFAHKPPPTEMPTSFENITFDEEMQD